ncbi:hypothetical protein EUGRSUZ_F02884 [Eucalyptus grandis]|uniref:Uncharacterized protein n=2 Tax=Eucalyptus grandis TaxID=71139 RepID=A0ACC3KJH1_EUCGR|nr:hypothetical protein EUGRSUZ_F02884 [Eucalyptus grandis]
MKNNYYTENSLKRFSLQAVIASSDNMKLVQSLRGPRGGMIFFKKEPVLGVDLESAINNAVFPGLQGGPHNHTIGGLTVSLKFAQSPEFKDYQNKVVSNCKALASRLIELGYKLVSGGSDNHLVLVDLRPLGIDGARVEKILDMASITLNKNSVPGDKSALVPWWHTDWVTCYHNPRFYRGRVQSNCGLYQ